MTLAARSKLTRVRGAALLVVVSALGLLAGLVAVPTASGAAGFTGGVSDPSARRDPPGVGDDFPRLPESCYAADGKPAPEPCHVTRFGSKRPMLVVWGDSHAWMYLAPLQQLATNRRVNLVYLLHGSCPASVRLPKKVDAGNSTCDDSNDQHRAYVASHSGRQAGLTVLIGGYWSGYRANYRRMQREAAGGAASGVKPYHQHMARLAVLGTPQLFKWLGRRGITTHTIAPAATVPVNARTCMAGDEPYQCDLPRSRALDREDDNRRWLQDRMDDLSGESLMVDATPAYCDDLVCHAHVGTSNTWYDDIHLGRGFTSQLAPYFRPVFDQIRADLR